MDSNITVDGWSFINNTARYGGAISISWNYLKRWTNTIQNSVFTNNVALEIGGAINVYFNIDNTQIINLFQESIKKTLINTKSHFL